MKAWTQLLEPGPALATICLVLLVSSQTHAAPTLPDENAEQSTEIEYYPVADATGCYYNFQHYDEGDRIITNEPCLNCTCHNRMLMCYLRVCPFTKAIGANCKVEKKPDQCCPVITCPEVPVQLVTSTSPSTALGHLNEYGCSIDNLFYSDGARVPSNPENPCELCYCIRNKTACVMQECTLNVEGCRPVFQEGVCCPVRYNCEHPEYLEGPTTPQISTTTTTTTTTAPPTTTLQTIECFFNGRSYNDGELVKKDIPCEKCYCLRGDIVCAVQECGPTPLDKVNCTALPIREGQCCPETYDCAGIIEEELTTLSSLSYETVPTTLPTVDLGITQGPLTTASEKEMEEIKKLEGLTETPEIVTTTKPSATEGQHLGELGEGEISTPIPEIIEQITRETVEAPKPGEQITEILSEQTTRVGIEEASPSSQEITEGSQVTEIEAVTKVGVETETTEKEGVTFVPAISPEEVTKAQEASKKPYIDEITTKPFAEEETTKHSAESETTKPLEEKETSKPNVEAETAIPFVKETSKPLEEVATIKPLDVDTAKPLVEEETSKPYVEEETAKPSIEETTKPLAEEATAKPSVEAAVVEEETSKPYVEAETVKPLIDEETTKPSEEEETFKPSVEADTAKPLVEEETAKPSLEVDTVTPALEFETVKPSVEVQTDKPSVGVETTKSSIEKETPKPYVEEETDKPSIEVQTAGPSVEVETDKPVVEEKTAQPSVEEDTAKPQEEISESTESPTESFTNRVTEVIETVTTRLTEVVDAITKVMTVTSSVELTTKVPEEEIVTEGTKQAEQPGKETVTVLPSENVTETERPEEELITRVTAITESGPAFPTHPSATEQSDIDSDKSGVTPAISDKEMPEKTSELSEKGPTATETSDTEKEQPETSEESVKKPTAESVIPAEQEPTTVSTEREQPKPVHDDHEGEDEHETKVPITEMEILVPTEEGVTSKQPQEGLMEPSATERTEASEVSEQTEPPQETPEIKTESTEAAVTGQIVTEKEPISPEEERTKKPDVPTEPLAGQSTEPTVETKPQREQVPVTEETIIPQDCGEQGCVKIPDEKPLTTEQSLEEGTSPAPGPSGQPAKEDEASVPAKPVPEQPTTTPLAEEKPETEKTLPSDTKPELTGQQTTEPNQQITTEKEEVVIVTEIPTKKTELPESMDHVYETVYPTESPEEIKPASEGETQTIKLEHSTSIPEVSKEPEQESTEQPTSESPGKEQETETANIQVATEKTHPSEVSIEEQTKKPSEDTEVIEGSTKPISATETAETTYTEQVSEKSKATETPFKTDSSATEVSKQEEASTEPKATEPVKGTKIPSVEVAQPTTELPKDEDNEIGYEEPGATVPKPEAEGTTAPEISVTEEGTNGTESTIHKKPEIEEQVTEKAIIPEVCTSDAECVPGAVPSLSENETESTKIPEEETSQSSIKPEHATAKPEGTTESNKIPETEAHTEESNEIPEVGTEGVSRVTGTVEGLPPYTEESSGEHPTEIPKKEEEGSGQEPEEGSGFTTSPQESGDTETTPKIKEEQPEVTTAEHEEVKQSEQPSETEEPATSKPQETSIDEGQDIEHPGTELTPEFRPTEYPDSTEYPEGSDIPEREIPGEGSCLVDGQTYKNNSSVPPINHCQTSCKCISSILRCESIECTPPPAGMQNCMPIFLSPDSCCPTYSCTGPETTSPMESDSHIIQTTTLPSQEVETIKIVQEQETEGPAAAVTDVATEEKEPESSEKSTEADVTEETVTEKSTELPVQPEKATKTPTDLEKSTKLSEEPEKSTELPVEPEKSTELSAEPEKSTELPVQPTEYTKTQGEVTEEPVVITQCDESGCKVQSTKPEPTIEQGTEKAPEATESYVTATSAEIGISHDTRKPESETKEPQPEEGIITAKPEKVTEATILEEGTVASEVTSQLSEELKPTDRVAIEEGQATEETATEEPEKPKPTEVSTEKLVQPEKQTVKPESEQTAQPETVTRIYDEELPSPTIVPLKESEKETPEEVSEISTTEESKGPEQSIATETTGIPYADIPEVSSETESEVTEEPEVVTRKGELVEEPITKQSEAEKKPSATDVTEEAPEVTSIETQTKLPLADSNATRKPKPEIDDLTEHYEEPSETTGLPEKKFTSEIATEPEKATKPSEQPEEGKTTEQPTRASETEEGPKVTELPEILELETSKGPLLASESPESTQPTADETSKLTTEAPEKESESPEPEGKIPHTTYVPKEEEKPVEHITIPPESESTGKPIESESHVTSQEATETTSSKATEEKSTERATGVPLLPGEQVGEDGKVTETPLEVSQPMEEASKPKTELPTVTEEATSTPETHIPTTESKESVKVTEPEITVTESLPSESTKKSTEESEKPVVTSVTEQSSISPEGPLIETTSASEITAIPQTEQTSEEFSESFTKVPTSVTENIDKESSKTDKAPEKITEKPTEMPSVEGTSRVSEIEKSSTSEEPLVNKEPSGEPSKTEKIPEEAATLTPILGGEEPSTEDNEIPGVVSEKDTPSVSEQGPETTEQPTTDGKNPIKELEKEPEIQSVTEEVRTQTIRAEEGETTSPSIISGSSIVPEEEQASDEGESTTLQSSKITPVSGQTEKPDITEEEKTATVEETTKEGELKPQTEKDTSAGETKEPMIAEGEGKITTTEESTTDETKMPSILGEEGKIPTVEHPVAEQTEQSSIPEDESKTLAPEQAVSQETEEPLPEEGATFKPDISEIEEPGKPEEGKTSTTQKTGIPDEEVTPAPGQSDDEATKPSISEEKKTGATEQPSGTQKPGISDEETKTPIVSTQEEAVTRKPVESVFESPEVTTAIADEKENATLPEHGILFTSGPKVETTTKLHVPGELSTSAPVSEPTTTISPATTVLPPTISTESLPAHIPGEQVPELPDYEQTEYEDEEQNAFGPGTCRYGGKVYVSAQQIPREDPCDFCFCFRSDIICLQQSCPPPIPRCHEEPIRGFCCPRYECPVSMATSVNITTSTTTTTTTLPPHFFSHAYKGRASKTGCQISGKAYKVGEAIRSTSGPCLHCTCGGDGQMKCDPKPCSPEPMLRQMIAAAASRRRR